MGAQKQKRERLFKKTKKTEGEKGERVTEKPRKDEEYKHCNHLDGCTGFRLLLISMTIQPNNRKYNAFASASRPSLACCPVFKCGTLSPEIKRIMMIDEVESNAR